VPHAYSPNGHKKPPLQIMKFGYKTKTSAPQQKRELECTNTSVATTLAHACAMHLANTFNAG